MSTDRIEKVRGNSSGGAIQQKGKLRPGDGLSRKLASGTAARDHLLDGVLRSVLGRLQWRGSAFERGKLVRRRLASPRRDFSGGIEGRGFVHFAHGGIVDLLFGIGDDGNIERRYLGRIRWRRVLVP